MSMPIRATSREGMYMNFGSGSGLVDACGCEEFGAHRARAERCDGNAGARQFAARTFAVDVRKRLCPSVSSLARSGQETTGGPDVEDGASSAGHHLLHCSGGEVDDGFNIDSYLGDLVFDR
jgi:hypothetical protein